MRSLKQILPALTLAFGTACTDSRPAYDPDYQDYQDAGVAENSSCDTREGGVVPGEGLLEVAREVAAGDLERCVTGTRYDIYNSSIECIQDDGVLHSHVDLGGQRTVGLYRRQRVPENTDDYISVEVLNDGVCVVIDGRCEDNCDDVATFLTDDQCVQYCRRVIDEVSRAIEANL